MHKTKGLSDCGFGDLSGEWKGLADCRVEKGGLNVCGERYVLGVWEGVFAVGVGWGGGVFVGLECILVGLGKGMDGSLWCLGVGICGVGKRVGVWGWVVKNGTV